MLSSAWFPMLPVRRSNAGARRALSSAWFPTQTQAPQTQAPQVGAVARRVVLRAPITYVMSTARSASRSPHVGASPEELAAKGVATADVYTYGAASQALSEGQAMAAWADLQKHQNYPEIKEVAAHATCPPGFLISPDGTTCVNQEDVHIALRDSVACNAAAHAHNEPGWATCSALVRYLDLNEKKAMASGSLPQVTDAAMRGLRALRMTTGSFGWKNVRTQLRAVAWVISTRAGPIADEWGAGWAPGDDQNVDELQEALEKSIGPYYDKDVANPPEAKKKSDATIELLIKSQFGTRASSSSSFTPGLVAALLLGGAAAVGVAVLHPSAAVALWRSIASTLT